MKEIGSNSLDPCPRRRNRKWTVRLTIVTALVIVAFVLVMDACVSNAGLREHWPGRDVIPEQVATVDLGHLGLSRAQIRDARSIAGWRDANFEDGAIAIYMAEQKEIVSITALRYSTPLVASNDFHGMVASAKENCGWSVYGYAINTGTMRCGFRNSHERLLWNGNWILHIFASNGGKFPAQELADQVWDAIAADWKRTRESND